MGKLILAADIGGTKTNIALFAIAETKNAIFEATYVSRNYKGLEEIVAAFLKQIPLKLSKKIVAACFGIAGPVRDQQCHTTNLPWSIQTSSLQKELDLEKVFLINDLEANGAGLSSLKETELHCLQRGKQGEGNRALISAGTGLGEAGLFWDGKRHHTFASEGGHASFAPENKRERELLEYLSGQGHVSVEKVLSGPALYQLYEFVCHHNKTPVEPKILSLIEKENPAKVIAEQALANPSSLSGASLELFVSIYGAEAGNLALKYFAIGGVYIGGGVAPKILPALIRGGFITAFTSKGRFGSFLKQIPVYVVLNEKTALLGAYEYARERV